MFRRITLQKNRFHPLVIATLSSLMFSCASTPTLKDQIPGLLQKTAPGSTLVIGERHTDLTHTYRQVEIINALIRRGDRIALGLELVEQDKQEALDQFLEGKIDKEQFRKAVKWNETYAVYESMIKTIHSNHGKVLALNSPRSLNRAVARNGISKLSKKQVSQLPPNFQLGSYQYKLRFGGVVPTDHSKTADNLFAAQCLWDDYMAWQAQKFKADHPDWTLVILSGDFHVAYKLGLPSRLSQRGVYPVTTVSQSYYMDQPVNERPYIEFHPKWGPRADFVFIDGDQE